MRRQLYQILLDAIDMGFHIRFQTMGNHIDIHVARREGSTMRSNHTRFVRSEVDDEIALADAVEQALCNCRDEPLGPPTTNA